MKLHTREWGSGDRIAVLVHGIMSDSRTWHRFGPDLAARGYRVIAVDLRGHGLSERGTYGPRLWSGDLLDTLPAEVDLAIGHSLGALTLAGAVEDLRPARAVYVDPAWRIGGTVAPDGFRNFKSARREQVAAMNPGWDDVDVDLEIDTLALWDPDTVDGLSDVQGVDNAPALPVVPSLVVAAPFMAPGVPPLVDEGMVGELRERGFEVRVVAGAGHTIHRDDYAGFLAALEGWL